MKNIFAVAAALALLAGTPVAYADSLDSPQTRGEFPTVTGPVVANTLASNTGNERPASFGGPVIGVSQGDLLAQNGVNGILQSANSAPAGFGNGTLATMTAQAANALHHG